MTCMYSQNLILDRIGKVRGIPLLVICPLCMITVTFYSGDSSNFLGFSLLSVLVTVATRTFGMVYLPNRGTDSKNNLTEDRTRSYAIQNKKTKTFALYIHFNFP